MKDNKVQLINAERLWFTSSIILGIMFFTLGLIFSYSSQFDQTDYVKGIMLGQGSVFLLWGIREISLSYSIKNQKEVK